MGAERGRCVERSRAENGRAPQTEQDVVAQNDLPTRQSAQYQVLWASLDKEGRGGGEHPLPSLRIFVLAAQW